MDIIRNIDSVQLTGPTVVTVGTFDGVHKGHLQIIEKMVKDAKRCGLESILMTFDPHPQVVLKTKGIPIQLLTSTDEKLEILSSTGLDRVIIIPFSQSFSQIEYSEFLESYLVKKLNMKKMVLGYDAALGHDRKGHLSQIKEHASTFKYELDIVPSFSINEESVNSTGIRNYLNQGMVLKAEKFLGRRYRIMGRVMRGDGRGKTLGFPTANIQPLDNDKLVPGEGVYAVKVNVDGDYLNGVMNIGSRPTFKNGQEIHKIMEAFIFNYDSDLYEKIVEVEFVEFIREEKKFDSGKYLIEQIKKDVINCKTILLQGEKNDFV